MKYNRLSVILCSDAERYKISFTVLISRQYLRKLLIANDSFYKFKLVYPIFINKTHSLRNLISTQRNNWRERIFL